MKRVASLMIATYGPLERQPPLHEAVGTNRSARRPPDRTYPCQMNRCATVSRSN